jgi:hypothetical protein
MGCSLFSNDRTLTACQPTSGHDAAQARIAGRRRRLLCEGRDWRREGAKEEEKKGTTRSKAGEGVDDDVQRSSSREEEFVVVVC